MWLQSQMCAHDFDRQWAIPSSAEYPRWRAITSIGDKLSMSPNIVVVPNSKQAYAQS